jgi:L-lysine 2,3-aminomutase/ferredoxin
MVTQLMRVYARSRPQTQCLYRTFSSRPKRTKIESKSLRLSQLQEKLGKEQPQLHEFVNSQQSSITSKYLKEDGFNDKAIAMLDLVNDFFNVKYSRGGLHGEGYVGIQEIVDNHANVFGESVDTEKLLKLAPEIQSLMRVKVSSSYLKHALEALPSNAKEISPILKVVVPDEKEVLYKEIGETDPSNQNKYSPLPGLLHKYNMLLAMTSINCSSHCRYCYRSDLFNGSSGKSKADISSVAQYVKAYNHLVNEAIETNGVFDSNTGVMSTKDGEPLVPLREILLSGGDVLTLPNSTIARYLVLMAESGIKTIRFGSKELVFNPTRFDENFFSTLDMFHQNYPQCRIELVGHYVHPFELVQPQTDENGNYLYDKDIEYTVHPEIENALQNINSRRHYFGHFNQFPVIAGVNDSPDVMRLLLHLTNKLGIVMHNVYACREVKGNPHFRGDLTITKQYDLLENAKIGLSGIENHARLIMSTEQGKMDVLGHKEGKVFLRCNRFVHDRKPDNTMIIVDSNKLEQGTFYWLTQDVIDIAVDEAGRELLNEKMSEETQFIKSIKKQAADIVRDKSSIAEETNSRGQQQQQSLKMKTSENLNNESNVDKHLIKIKIVGNNNNVIKEINHVPEDDTETLGHILETNGYVEMVCGGSLSCTTCVGHVATPDDVLTPPSLDELDATDSLKMDTKNDNENHLGMNLRCMCQVKVQQGKEYTFVSI